MKIYKISSSNTDKIYIGKSKQKYLSQRFAVHNYHYKLYLKNKFAFVSSFDVIKHGNCKIESLGEYSDEEAKEMEKTFIQQFKSIAVNKHFNN